MELVCVNHWPTAIETHQRNHPEARHFVQDISTVQPDLIVPEGYLDLLMASPTCTHHSNARGGKPTSDQQRSDPWHIITWLTRLRVKRIIIENVWEFTNWGPVNAQTGRPVKSRRGEYFMAWINALKALGFELEWRKLNAADFGDATTRKRFILMGRSDGKKIVWPMPTHRRAADLVSDMFASEKPWRPAREIIDWSIQGKSIFGRPKDLAPKTIARIYSGALKLNWPEPYLVVLRNHMAARGLDLPLPSIAANETHIGLAEPIILSQNSSGAPRPVSDPLPTITTGGAGSEIRQGCARPIVVTVAHGNDPREKDPNGRRANSVDEPLGAIHGTGSPFAIAEPFALSQASGGAARPVSSPLPTQTTGGNGGATALIAPYYGSGSGETAQGVDSPLPTITSKDRFGMVLPVTHAGGEGRAQGVDDPLPTVTGANRGELAVSEPGKDYDILFRMLEPHELAAAMGFNEGDKPYDFAGTKTDKIKQIGNAVSVSKMKACVGSIMADAAPEFQAMREAAE